MSTPYQPSTLSTEPCMKVQLLPQGSIHALSLQWEKLVDTSSKYDIMNIAYIPMDHIANFIKGENERPNAPTNFCVQWTKKHSEGSLKKPKHDSFKELKEYWCTYGPKDSRDNALEP